uniref:S-protein homolog n=1 Tax=Kalanchoe fedtschenkoi TaxID=63787 RepID=A0A7N0V837_KALFE
MDPKGVIMSVFAILLAMAILPVMNAQVAEARTCSWGFPKFYLSVENQMDKPATAIKVHCKSKDNDLGEHTLWNGMQTSFSFRPQVFGKTFFWCDVFWNDRWVVFDAYNDDRDNDRCMKNDCHCKWAITSKGPCFMSGETQKYDVSYSSNNPICKQIKMCSHDPKTPIKHTDSKWIQLLKYTFVIKIFVTTNVSQIQNGFSTIKIHMFSTKIFVTTNVPK